MKSSTKILVALMLLVVSVAPAFAADKAISIDARHIFDGLYSLEYESATGRDTSFTVQGFYRSAKSGSLSLSGFTTSLGLRKYMNSPVLNGPYIGGGPVLALISGKDGTDTVSVLGLGAAAKVGYKVLIGGGITVDLSGSLTMPLYTRAKVNSDSESMFGGDLGTSWDLFVGYAW